MPRRFERKIKNHKFESPYKDNKDTWGAYEPMRKRKKRQEEQAKAKKAAAKKKAQKQKRKKKK